MRSSPKVGLDEARQKARLGVRGRPTLRRGDRKGTLEDREASAKDMLVLLAQKNRRGSLHESGNQ